MNDNWEQDIADLLTDLAGVQGELLSLLSEKRQMLAATDYEALTTTAQREQQLIESLTACHRRRQQLLNRAGDEGLPSDSIRSLSSVLPVASQPRVFPEIEQAERRSRFLQQECLTNWVLVQQTLLHLSQMIEIIATGGRSLPTYGNGSDRTSSGALVDQAV
jgi:hypothetical protein